jgi:hypothetical protein
VAADATAQMQDERTAQCANEGSGSRSCRDQDQQEEGRLAYPGPIFATWAEVDAFLSEMALPEAHGYSSTADYDAALASRAAKVDRLQQDLQQWYAAMKTQAVRDIHSALQRAYDRK